MKTNRSLLGKVGRNVNSATRTMIVVKSQGFRRVPLSWQTPSNKMRAVRVWITCTMISPPNTQDDVVSFSSAAVVRKSSSDDWMANRALNSKEMTPKIADPVLREKQQQQEFNSRNAIFHFCFWPRPSSCLGCQGCSMEMSSFYINILHRALLCTKHY
uniref:Uncharacterized protein n=2 Tax=Graphocephala atropunctata TaxID=36148 RepID=A0A1B6LX92_9HEMI